MTKTVSVRIEGRQLQEEAPIITNTKGIYHFKNGKHFIQYEDAAEEHGTLTKHMIKISNSRVVLTKKLDKPFEMAFDRKETTQVSYQTPYGILDFDIKTYSILLKEDANYLEVSMEYSLSADGKPVSDHSLIIAISSLC